MEVLVKKPVALQHFSSVRRATLLLATLFLSCRWTKASQRPPPPPPPPSQPISNEPQTQQPPMHHDEPEDHKPNWPPQNQAFGGPPQYQQQVPNTPPQYYQAADTYNPYNGYGSGTASSTQHNQNSPPSQQYNQPGQPQHPAYGSPQEKGPIYQSGNTPQNNPATPLPRGPIQQQLQPPARSSAGPRPGRYPPQYVQRGPHHHEPPPQQQQHPPGRPGQGPRHSQIPNEIPVYQKGRGETTVPASTGVGALLSSAANLTFGSKDLRNLDKDAVFEGLKKLYEKKVKPLELASKYSMFRSPTMTPSDFTAKPMVLIVGQYSVGKTSFIRSLVGRDFPGQRVGPEPTTDRFTAIMYGEEERLLPGHVLVNSKEYPFMGLDTFGNNFLSKMEGAIVHSPILRNITLIDTPGVLSGEKQRIGRDYDFSSVISWFGERADLIIIMFDAHKLDISDELKSVIDCLRPHQDKMRILLNKADAIDTQQLMRVYGALMWSLGKVMMTPEVFRVYMGSFWDNELKHAEQASLLRREKQDLVNELMTLPDNAVLRRINELVKRARSVKVHAYIIHYLRKQMPYMYHKKEKQEKLIKRLPQQFKEAAARYELPLGDFPNVDLYRSKLMDIRDISKFPKLDKSLVYEMEKVFTVDIPKLLEKCTINRMQHFNQ